MQKLLSRIACLLITLAIGVVTVKVHRSFLFRPLSPQAIQAVAIQDVATETVWRCDEAPDLPAAIKASLDRHFPGWKFPVVSDEDCQSVKSWGGKDAWPQLIQGDFDGDGRLDYAVLFERASTTDGRGVGVLLNVYIVSFLKRDSGYKMKIVTREGGGSLQVMPKGDRDYDYDSQREFTYSNDTIFSGMGMGGSSYLYENGKFRAVITSD